MPKGKNKGVASALILGVVVAVLGAGLAGATIFYLRKTDDLRTTRQEYDDLKDDYQTLEREYQDARNQIDQLEDNLNRLTGEVSSLQRKITDREEIIDDLRDNINKLVEAASGEGGDISSLKSDISKLKEEIQYLKQELCTGADFEITEKPKEHVNAGEIVKVNISVWNDYYGEKDDPRDIAVPVWEDGEKVGYFARDNLPEGQGTSQPEEKSFVYLEGGIHTIKVGENEFSFRVYSPPQAFSIEDAFASPVNPRVGESVTITATVSNPHDRTISHKISMTSTGAKVSRDGGGLTVGYITIVDENSEMLELDPRESRGVEFVTEYDNSYVNPKVELVDASWTSHIERFGEACEDALYLWPYGLATWKNVESGGGYLNTPDVSSVIDNHTAVIELENIA